MRLRPVRVWFNGADTPIGDDVTTTLTLAACSEGVDTTTAVQMLVYNEFEQRFSTAFRMGRFFERPLPDIDTSPGTADDAFSIFAVGVQGTLVGQTRIRGVEGTETNLGHGVVAVASEAHHDAAGTVVGTTAFNVHYTGARSTGDTVFISNLP